MSLDAAFPNPMLLRLCLCIVSNLTLAALVVPAASAQVPHRASIDVEGGIVWLARNDVRIPNNDTATEFSLAQAVGNDGYGAVRVGADVTFNERHGLRVVFAPLRIDDTGALADDVVFAGERFPAGPIDATYQFSSYRATYRYRIFAGDRWQWRIGFTGFVRDARIALHRDEQVAEDTDVGFVPLLHLQGRARLSSRWGLTLEVDGLASTQGRAFDVAAKLQYELTDRWNAAFGYRTIEGGADVDDVFNFAWLNFAVASIGYGF